ncbi:beta-eliminating lyase-related protein [Porticoccaceae bacterium LTM1]|nr:beta-eliminating lyase-related protein [Porticoccaceae bacterium LTM1]
MSPKSIEQIRANCTKELKGQGAILPKEYFSQLANYTDENVTADVYGKGGALEEFEAELADLLGQEQCVFLPSGIMAQLVAMRIWSDQAQNSLIAFHPTSHLELHEEKAYQHLHNLQAIKVGEADQVMTLSDLQKMPSLPSALIMELPLREIGGQLPQWSELLEQVEYLRSKGVKVHLDGARLWECRDFYNKSYAEIAGLFDSVYVSFYKGIGAPSGAALLGSGEFIKQARVWIRRHGGNVFTSFPNYLAARKGVEEKLQRFPLYHQRAKEVAQLISSIEGVKVIPENPQINMFHIHFSGDAKVLAGRALEFAEREKIWSFAELQPTDSEGVCRFEWYVGEKALEVSDGEVERLFRYVVGDN